MLYIKHSVHVANTETFQPQKRGVLPHRGLGDRHLSDLSGKVYHRKITFEAQHDRNVTLESKFLRQKFIDITYQIIICDHP